jgi:hypothetical protein
MEKLIMGSDPELFIKSRRTKKFVSALKVLKDSNKYNPIYTKSGEKLYPDGLAIEGTVKPADSKDKFVESISNFINDSRHILGKSFTVSNKASHVFQNKDFAHPESRILGCNSALDVFRREEIRPIPGSEMKNLRTCGGHLHFSSTGEILKDFANTEKFIKILNLIVATSLNVVDNDETSPERKELYGTAGEFRVTEYGCEMRTPSNYWLGNKELTELVYDLCQFSFEVLQNGQFDEYMNKIDTERLINSINKFDREDCLAILEEINLPAHLLEKIKELKNEYV